MRKLIMKITLLIATIALTLAIAMPAVAGRLTFKNDTGHDLNLGYRYTTTDIKSAADLANQARTAPIKQTLLKAGARFSGSMEVGPTGLDIKNVPTFTAKTALAPEDGYYARIRGAFYRLLRRVGLLSAIPTEFDSDSMARALGQAHQANFKNSKASVELRLYVEGNKIKVEPKIRIPRR